MKRKHKQERKEHFKRDINGRKGIKQEVVVEEMEMEDEKERKEENEFKKDINNFINSEEILGKCNIMNLFIFKIHKN